MIQEIGELRFDNQYRNQKAELKDYVLVFRGKKKAEDQVLVHITEDDMISIPRVCELQEIQTEELIYLFSIEEEKFYLWANPLDKELFTKQYQYETIRSFRRCSPKYLSFAGMAAYHLFTWYRDSKFCGMCGAKTIHDEKQRMMRCPSCGNMIYPRVAPAVIVGLRHGDSILMSRYAGRPYKGRALLAGFCEIGETAEETVAREVYEEVGLKVKNITYYGSQPWGFDSNLLLGYYADVDGDTEIQLDEDELESARFVPRDEIEYEPNLNSLTATMIEEFRLGKA